MMLDNNDSKATNTLQYLLKLSETGKSAFTGKGQSRWFSPDAETLLISAVEVAAESEDLARIIDFIARNGGLDVIKSKARLELISSIDRVFDLPAADFRKMLAKRMKAINAKKPAGNLLEMIAEMNQTHALTMIGGKSVIMRSIKNPHDLSETRTEFIRSRELIELYKHELYDCGVNAKGEVVMRDKINAWISHPECRRYQKGVYFKPFRADEEPLDIEESLNLWTGLAVSPTAGDWSLIDWHIKNVLAGGDQAVYEYILNWCARIFQHPNKQAGTVLVFRGKKRTGKGFFGHFLRKIWGEHGLHISNAEHLTGKFNGHLSRTCLLFSDEAFFAGDRKHEGVLKSMITDPVLSIEEKGLGMVQMMNMLKIVMATNEDWAVPTSADDARYLIADVSDVMKNDNDYFKKLWAMGESREAQSAFVYDMLNRDISNFHAGNIPDTEGAREQRHHSLDYPEKWWLDCLNRGWIIKQMDSTSWVSWLSSSDIYDSYIFFCDQLKLNQYSRISSVELGRWMSKNGFSRKKINNSRGWVLPESAEIGLEEFNERMGL